VTEPTDLHVGVGHKGFAWFEIETHGRAAHGSRPRDGRDAILRMGRVLNRLERLDRDLQLRPPHPIMATASLHASIIDGGRELSSYPDRCRLQMERRTIAGETDQSAAAELTAMLDSLAAGSGSTPDIAVDVLTASVRCRAFLSSLYSRGGERAGCRAADCRATSD
jgi:acetylornithine deacetylase